MKDVNSQKRYLKQAQQITKYIDENDKFDIIKEELANVFCELYMRRKLSMAKVKMVSS